MKKTGSIYHYFFRKAAGAVAGLAILSLVFIGCDNSGNHMSGDNTTAGIHTGVFADSPVQGLYYETDTQDGYTDENGTFTYMDGETVTFHLGDLELGQTTAKPVLTPIDLVDGAKDETDQRVTNMCRLLQTLDEDENPENGIDITQETSDAITTDSVDFMMDETDFENQDAMLEIMDNLMNVQGFENGRMMVSGDQAQAHMRETMMNMGMMDEDSGSMMGDEGMMSGAHSGNNSSVTDGSNGGSDETDVLTNDGDPMGSGEPTDSNGTSYPGGMM